MFPFPFESYTIQHIERLKNFSIFTQTIIVINNKTWAFAIYFLFTLCHLYIDSTSHRWDAMPIVWNGNNSR